MPEENVEIVREVIEVLSAREVPAELITDDVRFQNVPTAVTDKVYMGHEGVREWQRDFFGVMDREARLEIEEVLGVGTDNVVVRLRLAGHGLASGAPLELRWCAVFWLHEGRVTHERSFARRGDALEAAGLSE